MEGKKRLKRGREGKGERRKNLPLVWELIKTPTRKGDERLML